MSSFPCSDALCRGFWSLWCHFLHAGKLGSRQSLLHLSTPIPATVNNTKNVTNRMQGPTPGTVNTRPKPRPTSTTDPSKATKLSEDWSIPVEPMFIADVVAEHARVLHEAERRMKREEVLDDSSSGPFNAAQFAVDGPQVQDALVYRCGCRPFVVVTKASVAFSCPADLVLVYGNSSIGRAVGVRCSTYFDAQPVRLARNVERIADSLIMAAVKVCRRLSELKASTPLSEIVNIFVATTHEYNSISATRRSFRPELAQPRFLSV